MLIRFVILRNNSKLSVPSKLTLNKIVGMQNKKIRSLLIFKNHESN